MNPKQQFPSFLFPGCLSTLRWAAFRWAAFRWAAFRWALLCAFVTLTIGVTPGAASEPKFYRASTDREYQDVFDDVHFAIAEHNFRITGGNAIGNAIQDRQEEPFPRSDIVHFCNLEFARRLLEIDATLLNHMPCKVVIYQQGSKIVVETRLLDENHPEAGSIAAEVNAILKGIVDYAGEQ